MLTELCVAVSRYASSGRWEHQQLYSGTGITRSWEGGNVAEMARTCLKVLCGTGRRQFQKYILPCSRERKTSVQGTLSQQTNRFDG